MSSQASQDTQLVVKVCRLFYEEGLTQLEISERLRISRFRVARILREAVERGIVQITIREPASTSADLERSLERAFGLRQAIVVATAGQDEATVKGMLGKAAADYLHKTLRAGDVLGVSWGTTVNEVANALQPRRPLDIQVVQITGGLNQVSVHVNAPELTRRIAEAFQSDCHLLYVPAIVDEPSVRDALLADSSVRRTVQWFDKVTVGLVGIGALAPDPTSTLVHAGYIGERELAMFAHSRVVGDVFSHFYDVDGNIQDCGLNNRVIAMTVEQIRRVPYVIGVAGRRHKGAAILGALRGKLINVLVTDEDAARCVLELNSNPSD